MKEAIYFFLIKRLFPNKLCSGEIRLEKEKHGLFEAFQEKNSIVNVCMWNDTVQTNFEEIFPLDSISRWNHKSKMYVNVDRLGLIPHYNKYMGGTDQMDEALACYLPYLRDIVQAIFCILQLLKLVADLQEANNSPASYSENSGDSQTFFFLYKIIQIHRLSRKVKPKPW